MEVFEVHITGDEKILYVNPNIKTISVELLTPDSKVIRIEYMTSIVFKCVDFNACKALVYDLVTSLLKAEVYIFRIKIECPYYKQYVDRSKYMESHFISSDFKLPTSKNVKKTTFLATDRTYIKSTYDAFADKYKDAEVELCVYDTNIDEDKDWMSMYGYFKQN